MSQSVLVINGVATLFAKPRHLVARDNWSQHFFGDVGVINAAASRKIVRWLQLMLVIATLSSVAALWGSYALAPQLAAALPILFLSMDLSYRLVAWRCREIKTSQPTEVTGSGLALAYVSVSFATMIAFIVRMLQLAG